MRRALRGALCVLLAGLSSWPPAGAAAGCPPQAAQLTPEAIRAAADNARDRGFLWRISKEGRSSFLYGTIHIARQEWTAPGPAVVQALRATDTVALELDMLDAHIQERMARGVAAAHATALPAPLASRLRRQAESLCVPYESLASLTPEMQVIELSLMEGQWDGLFAAYGIDVVLAGIGHREKKRVVSLETPELQLRLLQMRSPQETIAFVQDALDELLDRRSRKLVVRMSRAWDSGDDAEMARYAEWCQCLDTEIEREMMKRTLDDRNPDLAQHIDALHAGGRQVFAAVGTLHMFGPGGLPALMQKRGYRVERVSASPR